MEEGLRPCPLCGGGRTLEGVGGVSLRILGESPVPGANAEVSARCTAYADEVECKGWLRLERCPACGRELGEG